MNRDASTDAALQAAFAADQGTQPQAILFTMRVPDRWRGLSRASVRRLLWDKRSEIIDEMAATIEQHWSRPVDVAALHRNMGEALRGTSNGGGQG